VVALVEDEVAGPLVDDVVGAELREVGQADSPPSTSTLNNHRSDAALSLAGVTSRKRGTEVRPLPIV